MNRQVVVGSVLVLLAVSSVSAVTTAQEGTPSEVLGQPEGFDQTTFEITVLDNGSARWAIKHHRRLANDSEVQQFEDFADQFERNETDLYLNFVSRAESLTTEVQTATGRQMEAKAFDRAAYTNVTTSFGDRGTIELQFTWTQFGQTDSDRVVVGDVFGENFYIGPSQAIVFERGPGLAFVDARPEPTSQTEPNSLTESRSVSWEGEQTFAQERPYVELAPQQTTANGETPTESSSGPSDSSTTRSADTSAERTETSTPTEIEPIESGTRNPMVWVVGVIIVVLGVSSAIAYRTGSVSMPGQTADTTGATETAAPSDDGTTETQTPIPDEELLSDSDRVVKLLEDNGGRMKQVNIVDETEWSKSKVSMLLSDMEEEDEISKLRVGRENIISLAGHEPDAAGSPFDDEE